MQVLILAAGFGDRMGDLSVRPKALLKMKRGCVLDKVVTSAWVEGVRGIHVLHNNAVVEDEVPRSNGIPRKVKYNWSREFRQWKRSLRWIPEADSRQDAPYVKLVNNEVSRPEKSNGSVGDLSRMLKRLNYPESGLVVMTCDIIRPAIDIERLCKESSSVECRRNGDLRKAVMDGSPSFVVVGDEDRVECVESESQGGQDSLVYVGALYIHPKDYSVVEHFAELCVLSGTLADSLGELVDYLASESIVRAVKMGDGDHVYDCGTFRGYKDAERLVLV